MDIRGWPLGHIMELPDCCFGRRFPVFFGGDYEFGGTNIFISEIGLPDVCVLWEVSLQVTYAEDPTGITDFRMAYKLGDKLPATAGEVTTLEDMFPESDEKVAIGSVIRPPLHMVNIRKPYHAQGRRVVLDVQSEFGAHVYWNTSLVFSSIPTEVPDCLVSGSLKNQS